MKRKLSLLVLLIFGLCLTAAAQRRAAVTGVVVDRQQRPAPGLAVFLVAPQGRSAPRTTDRNGRFLFTDVAAGQGYWIEVYWGRDLMYRKPVVVQADTNLGVIRL